MARVGVTNMESYIRGVTTLHHYERISSRDLGWHRRENGRARGKTKLLLWQTSETKEPWEVKQFLEKNTMEMNEITNTPLEKENKEHYENLVGWKTWKNAKRKTKPDHKGNIITHSRKWQELELQIWKVTSGVLQHSTTTRGSHPEI